jgi:hypothetical protein
LIPAASEFLDEAAGFLGAYLDGEYGYALVLERLNKTQAEMAPKLEMTVEQMDAADYLYGDGDPNLPDTKVLIKGTQLAVKNRNALGGPNTIFLGRMVIVAIYQLWEDKYRALIAEALKVEKNALGSDLFGDLRQYRRSVVHNHSVAIPEVASNKVLKWFQPGDPVSPSMKQMQMLIGLLADELKRLGNLAPAV